MPHSVRRSGFLQFAVGLTFVTLATGCLQPSLNPLFLPQDTFFEEKLLGTWTCSSEVWTFARDSYKGREDRPFYRVTITGQKPAELVAWLGRIDKTAFITFRPDKVELAVTDFVRDHIVGLYTFGRITIEAGHVRLAMLDAGWIEKAEQAGQLTIGVRQWVNDVLTFEDESRLAKSSEASPKELRWLSQVILTAQPNDLQRFARAYSDEDDVFAEKIELVRGTSSTAITTPGLVEQRGRCYSVK
jgi:hypothetical protein